jgi:hypothetical protein
MTQVSFCLIPNPPTYPDILIVRSRHESLQFRFDDERANEIIVAFQILDDLPRLDVERVELSIRAAKVDQAIGLQGTSEHRPNKKTRYLP